jgi:hypothetical protein
LQVQQREPAHIAGRLQHTILQQRSACSEELGIRPLLMQDAAYRTMAEDEAREADALEWAEALIRDAADATR